VVGTLTGAALGIVFSGSLIDDPYNLRSAARNADATGNRNDYVASVLGGRLSPWTQNRRLRNTAVFFARLQV